MQRLTERQSEPPLPDVTAEYLLGYLMEIGPTSQGGAGPAPIGHGEIAHWQSNTGIELTAWEARTLRHLSREYLGEMHAAESPVRPAPYKPVEVGPGQVAAGLRGAIGRLAKL